MLNYISATEAASLIQHGQMIGLGGFGPAGSPKAVTPALAQRARAEHEQGRPFRLDVVTGASIGASCDGLLSEAQAIDRRLPFSVNPSLRRAFNQGEVRYTDLNLSDNATFLRQGVTGPVSWAIIEAVALEEVRDQVRVYPTAGIGIAPTISRLAEQGVIIELNEWHSQNVVGMHDVYEIEVPWLRRPIGITTPVDRIGLPYISLPREKVRGVVRTNLPDEARGMTPPNEVTQRTGAAIADFMVWNMERGYISPRRLTLQSGVGSAANAVLGALGNCRQVPDFRIYTEVLQEEPVRLLGEGRVVAVSTGALTVSPQHLRELYRDMRQLRGRLVIRPSEISNCPEVIYRLGVCSINTALEVDIYGHVNSTKVGGTHMMNGVGGSCDFTTAAMLSIFTCGSTAKDGRISSIVPFCSHVDHTEHYVDAIATEYGVADLRGLCATDKAKALIRIAHPDYRPLLTEYLRLAERQGGHTHHLLPAAFAMHDTYRRKGDMRLTDWSEYIIDA